MSEIVNFADAAALRPEDVKIPNRPQGTYIAEIPKAIADPEATADGYGQMIVVPVRLISPIDNFENPEQLEAYMTDIGDPSGSRADLRFYVPIADNPNKSYETELALRNRRAANDVMRFFETTLGLGAKSFAEYRAEAVGARFLLTISWEQDPDAPGEFVEKRDLGARHCAPLEG